MKTKAEEIASLAERLFERFVLDCRDFDYDYETKKFLNDANRKLLRELRERAYGAAEIFFETRGSK